MPREDVNARRELPLNFTMSHRSTGRIEGGRLASFTITDATSRITIAEFELTPEQFYSLLSGMDRGDEYQARVAGPADLARVGHQVENFTRKIGYGISEEIGDWWAKNMADKYGLDRAGVHGRQGGLWAEWTRWVDPELTDRIWSGDQIRSMIDSEELPPGAK